ncbi:hypothetical protein OCU04_011161 [Sclerotinia nivalis]|uniref:Uncharacterized protein n=1 Tax=Sclerotinia nivalis TaxID=352851 RepID=A0A9X0AB89_9HELO|nr:hypothetical protein OCU04_011161 [Sclerotinia nivalis]
MFKTRKTATIHKSFLHRKESPVIYQLLLSMPKIDRVNIHVLAPDPHMIFPEKAPSFICRRSPSIFEDFRKGFCLFWSENEGSISSPVRECTSSCHLTFWRWDVQITPLPVNSITDIV